MKTVQVHLIIWMTLGIVIIVVVVAVIIIIITIFLVIIRCAMEQ